MFHWLRSSARPTIPALDARLIFKQRTNEVSCRTAVLSTAEQFGRSLTAPVRAQHPDVTDKWVIHRAGT